MPIAKDNPGSLDSDSFPVDSLPEEINPRKYAMPRPGKKRFREQSTVKSRHGWYSDAKKLEVACTYAVTGNSRRCAELTRVNEATIRSWKQTEWWQEIMKRIKDEKNEELDVKLTQVLDRAVDNINDRLEGGDYIYDAKRGELIRKPVSAKELALITAISVDKRQLLRGEPTSMSGSVSQNERLLRLQEQFKKFTNAVEINSVAQRIEEETYDASSEREVEESNLPEYQDGEAGRETTETGDSYSDEQSWEEQEKEEQETLTVNEMFSE